jgi:hypothetical protein
MNAVKIILSRLMTINKPHSVLQLEKKRQIWYNTLNPKEQAFTGIADKYANSLKKKSW